VEREGYGISLFTRDQPLPATLPLGDEHPPLGGAQVFQTQPENLAAA